MTKYENAIQQYAHWQQEIKRLSTAIGNAAMIWADVDVNDYGETVLGESKPRCQHIDENHKSCIDRLWAVNKQNYYNRECGEDYGEPLSAKQEELPPLCGSCTQVQALVNERKEAKKQFGIAKTRISNLGRKLMEDA